MPRGVRRTINYDEQLKSLDDRIAALQDERKHILRAKEENDLRTLTNFMAQNNLTPSDVIAAVTAREKEHVLIDESA